jgi:hypothetical protein
LVRYGLVHRESRMEILGNDSYDKLRIR